MDQETATTFIKEILNNSDILEKLIAKRVKAEEIRKQKPKVSCHTVPYLFVYRVTSHHKKTATSSWCISKATKHANSSKPTNKPAESKRNLVTW